MTTDPLSKDLAAIARNVRSGRISATELIRTASRRHLERGDELNAYRSWDGNGAIQLAQRMDCTRAERRGNKPLWGIPISVKDLFGQKEADTYAGSSKRLPEKWETEGPFVSAFRQAGAIFVGRTNMVEFAFGAVGANSHWPEPRNLCGMAVSRLAGGSSSGAGVSLCEGSALVALGSDTAGSVRIPASVTGTVGFKPSNGRWSTKGMVPLSPTFDSPGFLTRTVRDAAYVFDAIDPILRRSGTASALCPADLRTVTMGRVEQHFWDACDPGIAERVEGALNELSRVGVQQVCLEMDGLSEAYSLFADGGLAASEFREFLGAELPEWSDTLDARVAARLDVGPEYGSLAYHQRRSRFEALGKSANLSLSRVDVLATPTVPITAPRSADVKSATAYHRTNLAILRNTCVANLLNFCALTLPVGLDDEGVPVGLQLISPAGNDRNLIKIGLAIEECLSATW
ncbi:aspartyl-tRNA(Asn)/glutamyl-tRNA(Gln) amidotransferase subunit A [Roseovarius lutimaris]|uniref:Aspartyl-tRNA(Asn)/glutamyl-tRNA(Gln) amidotransferase subunit A n=1 Tax=Roseovarius lutimaris TaxID=1005928 RepID=A0A1I5GSG3_9RHOB|nr:amidase [Roseovarius lutimaris]SFO38942.1 aspartyl-tRNA(Asn)/glutamyl-tRNA(Gln) amidotransferase subunit A [Roseovarius lutimaris]